MSTTVDWWDELATLALLGSDRRPAEGFSFLPGALGDAATRSRGEPAAVLLDVAAMAVGYRRGGVRPVVTAAEADRAPADDLLRPGRAAAARLADLLRRNDLELVMWWCSSALGAGRSAPPECLPELLDLGTRQPLLRPAVAGVLGSRGRWLARMHEPWTAAFPNPGPRAAPALARDTPAGSWEQEPGSHRARLLGLSAEGLGPDEEPFLEAALDDRRADVRRAAAELLSTLRTSRYSQRMLGRATSFVRSASGSRSGRSRLRRLVVSVPDRLDAAAARDGITDVPPGVASRAGRRPEAVQQWWLEQVVAATPLAAWQQLGDDPREVLAADVDEPWRQALRAGWAGAAVRQRDRDWAVALLESPSRHRVEELLALLAAADLVPAVRHRLAGLGPAEVMLAVRWLAVVPLPWPDAVAADVLAWVLRLTGALHPRSAEPLLNLMSYWFPPGTAHAVRAAAEDLPPGDPWRHPLRAAARVIALRTLIHEELQ